MAVSRRVGIRDVALKAGVSTTTVSDALSGRGRLGQSTRDRVSEIAAALGYSANPSARWLRSGRTGALGLYFPESTVGLEYYMRLALGAADEAFAHGMALTLVPTWHEAGAVPPLHMDGVVVSDPMIGDVMLSRLSSLNVPVVTCERDVTPGARHAGMAQGDHGVGTALLFDHLTGAGAHRVAVLCPTDDTSFGQDVRASYRDWCARHGAPALIYDVPLAVSAREVGEAVHRALSSSSRPDAIVAVPDGSLTPTLHAIHAAGLEVPKDLLLAAYVDTTALSSLPVPVTAVDLQPAEMGRQATRLLARVIDGDTPWGTSVDVPLHLKVRASTMR